MPEKSESLKYRRYYRALEEAAQKPQTQAYSGAVFSFLAVSLFRLYAILPTMRTVLFLRRDIADKTRVNTQMEEKITALIEAQAAYEAAGEQLELVGQAIPTTPQAVELAVQLRNLARITGASISAVQIAAVPLVTEAATVSATVAPPQSDYPVSVTIVGSFPAIQSFLEGLISMRRIVLLESLRIIPAAGVQGLPTGGTILQHVLKLKAYYR